MDSNNDNGERIFKFTKPPALILGSGITTRYVKNAPGWEELLSRVGKRFGIDESMMIILESSAKNYVKEHPNEIENFMPRLATEMEKEFNERARKGYFRVEDILTKEEHSYFLETHLDPVRIMVASELKNIELDNDSSKTKELSYLRSLRDNVPCIITTNYDTVLEDQIFENKLSVYQRISDYYLSGSQGIGEIYKIHGSCTDPKSLVFDEQDYISLLRKSKIITSKILSILCDYPVVIMGQSMKDDDIRRIISDLISSLDDDKLPEIEKNVVYVAFEKGKNDIEECNETFENGNQKIILKGIRTDNFERIFKEISEIEPSASPSTIRGLRKLVKQIALSNTGGRRLITVGIDNIQDIDLDKMAIAVGPVGIINTINKMTLYPADYMVKDIIEGSSQYNPENVIDFFEKWNKQAYSNNQYVPIYYFIRKSKRKIDWESAFWTKYNYTKNGQFDKKINAMSRQIHLPDSENKIPEFIYSLREDLWPMAVMLLYDKGKLSVDKTNKFLKEIYSKLHESNKFNSIAKSNFMCALTYVSFKLLGLRTHQ